MANLEHPVFDEPYGRLLEACGELKTRDPKVLSRLARVTRKPLEARVGKGIRTEYVSILGSGGSKHHFHVNVAKPSYFSKPPRKTDPLKKVSEGIEQFFGEDVRVMVSANFLVPLDKLPRDGFVRLTLADGKVAGIPIHQFAASFTFGEKEAQTVLSFRQTNGDVSATLIFVVDTVIGSAYLRNLYAQAYRIFERLILGEIREVANVKNQAASISR